MKKKKEIFLLVFCVCLMILLEVYYENVIFCALPPDWNVEIKNGSDTFYPEEMSNRLADCFFGMNYLIFAYLFFEYKYYLAQTQKLVPEEETEKSWHWLMKGGICQIAALGVYSLVWLAYSRESRLPVDVPIRFARLYIQKHGIELPMPEFFQSVINVIIILAPMSLYLLIYLFHVMLRWCQFRMQDCMDRKWRNWNLLYILGTAVLLVWACCMQVI